jgi:hypothetical protein
MDHRQSTVDSRQVFRSSVFSIVVVVIPWFRGSVCAVCCGNKMLRCWNSRFGLVVFFVIVMLVMLEVIGSNVDVDVLVVVIVLVVVVHSHSGRCSDGKENLSECS